MEEEDPIVKIWNHLAKYARERHDEMDKVWNNLKGLADWNVASDKRIKRLERNLMIVSVSLALVSIATLAVAVVVWVK